MRRVAAVMVATIGFCSIAAAAVESSGIRETVMRAPVVDAHGHRESIEVTVFRPDGRGPFPLVVLSHGSPFSVEARRSDGRQRMAVQSRPFLEMGYAVLVPTRRGYGESGGSWAETYGSCADPDYYLAGLETARDIRSSVDAVRDETWADTTRVVLAGQSAGGFGSVAASATDFPGLVAVVNFAGGRGAAGPNDVCVEGRLVEAMGKYGRQARVPELWIYSANDLYFGPALAHRMHSAFVAAGGRAEFFQPPATASNGHGYFAWMWRDWSPRVEAFLRRADALPAGR